MKINLTEFGAASAVLDDTALGIPMIFRYSGKHLTEAYLVFYAKTDLDDSIVECPVTIELTWDNDDLIGLTTRETSVDGSSELVESYTMSYSDELNPFFGCVVDPVEISIFDNSYLAEIMLHYFGLFGSHSKHCCTRIKDNISGEESERPSTLIEYIYDGTICTGVSYYNIFESIKYYTILYKEADSLLL